MQKMKDENMDNKIDYIDKNSDTGGVWWQKSFLKNNVYCEKLCTDKVTVIKV